MSARTQQPLRDDDIEGMKFITEHIHTPVMADESSFGPKEAIALIRMRGAYCGCQVNGHRQA